MAAPLVTLPSPLPSPDDARRKRDEDVLAAVSATSTRTALVSAVTGSLVSLTNLLGDDIGDAARVSGFALSVGDLVLLAPVVGQAGDVEWIVVGKIDPSAPGAKTIAEALTVAGGIVNGDAGWSPQRQDAADTASTPNTATFVDAMSASLTLPDGMFTVKCLLSLTMKRSPAGQAHLRAVIDGNNGATRVVNLDASLWTTHLQTGFEANVAGGRTITLKIQYKGDSGTGVTTSAIEPLIWAVYERTAP